MRRKPALGSKSRDIGRCASGEERSGRLTNTSNLLWSAAVIVFLLGLISKPITALTYRRHD